VSSLSIMDLPLMPPIAPMLAKSVKGVPEPSSVAGGLLYEPKWDGFRCIVFRDGDEVELTSRGERPLTRYFPEVVDAVRAQLPKRCVVDGEIVIATGQALDFEALLLRIHPAASRVKLLAIETPASFIAFDLLALGDDDLTKRPFGERRALLVEALTDAVPPVYVTPATDDVGIARQWFETFEGAGLDGVVAKPLEGTYKPDERAMLKVKHERTADCVVAGFRWHKSGGVVGSLLLGLYDDAGELQHVGVCAAFSMKRRAELVEELAAWRTDDLDAHPWGAWASFDRENMPERMPGAVSRWNAGKDLSWVALRPERVIEVAYDHMEGSRFRHTAQWRRWRDDRDPHSCTYAQLERPVTFDLASVLGGSS
jgi:ATP-dependent DNA ligase